MGSRWGDANLVPQTIVVRGIVPNRRKAIDAPYGQIVAELRDELADGAEVVCLCCAANFCSTKDFGAIIVRPDSIEEGNLGAVCKECALAATNDDLIRVFQAELGGELLNAP
jgi:hypothetical protein